MKAVGIVVSVDGKFAMVTSKRESMCSSCEKCEMNGKCSSELIFGKQSQDITVNAFNGIGAKCGDTVEVESSSLKTLMTAMLVFVLPVFLSLVGYIIADRLTQSIYVPAASMAVVFVVSFFLIAKFMNEYAKSHIRIEIVKIIEESEN